MSMWTDPFVEEIHQTRADITLRTGDNSDALTLVAQEMTWAAGEKFGVKWCRLPVSQREIAPKAGA
jgi:hypothetical protein